MRESFRQWAREKSFQEEMRQTGGTPTSANFHRRAYHRHFQGYTEVKTVKPDGRKVIERVYTGHYLEPVLSKKQRIRLRIVYCLLFVAGVGIFAWSATRRAVCNSVLYVGIFQALTVLMTLWCLYVLIFYLPARGRWTVGDYDSLHKPLIRSSLACALCQAAAAVASLTAIVLNRDAANSSAFLCAGGFLLGGGLFGLMGLLESRVEYTVLDNETPMPEDGVEIDV